MPPLMRVATTVLVCIASAGCAKDVGQEAPEIKADLARAVSEIPHIPARAGIVLAKSSSVIGAADYVGPGAQELLARFHAIAEKLGYTRLPTKSNLDSVRCHATRAGRKISIERLSDGLTMSLSVSASGWSADREDCTGAA